MSLHVKLIGATIAWLTNLLALYWAILGLIDYGFSYSFAWMAGFSFALCVFSAFWLLSIATRIDEQEHYLGCVTGTAGLL